MSHFLCTPSEHSLSRRAFLGTTLGALCGLASPGLAEALRQREKQVLFVWLDGGISQLESWDPKPNTEFGGPFRSIPTSVPGVHVSELMPRIAKQMHRLCVVRSMCTKDNAHSSGVDRIQRGDPLNRGVTYPHFGSAVAHLMGPTASRLPPYVWIKPGNGGFRAEDAGFLGPKYGSLAFGDGKPPENLLRHPALTAEQDEARNELRAMLDRRYAARRGAPSVEANATVFDMASELMKRADIFDTTKLPPRDIERYGVHDFGRHMLIARRMLEEGVRFVKVTSYGWDTHGDNFNAHATMVPKFDQAFGAMLEDLAASGLLEHVLVVCLSEFGRTPRVNGHVGRDHWPEAWSLAMAGCGLQRGVVTGATNDKGTFVKDDGYDIGALFHTWYRALGIDSVQVEFDNKGQPLPIAHDEMRAIKEVLA
ncbi:MAG: DUF1501 domain-containing protein [Verrucomicrobiota bacterium]|nr:DUF1501 domain-containing protein [Verrucomicrobiota bacterium]